MEIGEIIASPVGHTSEHAECPFCPSDDGQNYKSYIGGDHDGGILGKIMLDPSKLAKSLEKEARPKAGGPGEQPVPGQKSVLTPELSHPEFQAYTYEAHHLVPGQEYLEKSDGTGERARVLKGHLMERWLSAEYGYVKKDSGYSINNSDNGAWLPSVTKKNKKGKGLSPEVGWAAEKPRTAQERKIRQLQDAQGLRTRLTQDEKRDIANYAMSQGAGQFHKGGHQIAYEGCAEFTYPTEVANRLSQLEELVSLWAFDCRCKCEPGSEPAPPFDATWVINEKMDLVSISVQLDIQFSHPSTWTYFVSTYARDYTIALRQAYDFASSDGVDF